MHLLYRKTYFSLHRTDADIHIMLNHGDSGVTGHLPLPMLVFCWFHLSMGLFFVLFFAFLRCSLFLNISASPVHVLIFYLQCLKFIFSSIYSLSFNFIIISSPFNYFLNSGVLCSVVFKFFFDLRFTNIFLKCVFIFYYELFSFYNFFIKSELVSICPA